MYNHICADHTLTSTQVVDYATEKDAAEAGSTAAEDAFEDLLAIASPVKKTSSRRQRKNGSESDTDFQAETEDESDPEPELQEAEPIRPEELGIERGRGTTANASSTLHQQNSETIVGPPGPTKEQRSNLVPTKVSSRAATTGVIDLSSPKAPTNPSSPVKPFKRAHLPIRSPLEPTYGSYSNRVCPACRKQHPQGACELKAAGVEHCGLCGLAHYGYSRTCPHIKSETQVRAMLEALKNSNEPKELVDLAVKYLRGVKGTLVQQKKRDREKAAAQKGELPPSTGTSSIGHPPKVRASTNTAKPISTGPPHGAPYQFPVGPPAQFPVGPQREVPSWYTGSDSSAVGWAGGQRTPAEQQRVAQMQSQGQLDEQGMETALRGYLGH